MKLTILIDWKRARCLFVTSHISFDDHVCGLLQLSLVAKFANVGFNQFLDFLRVYLASAVMTNL